MKKLNIETIADFIQATNKGSDSGFIIRPLIVCNDGFRFSVQASKGHYSSPRSYADSYTAFEVGFPSEADELLTPFADNPDEPTETVYGYVSANIIDSVIAKHGGIKELI